MSIRIPCRRLMSTITRGDVSEHQIKQLDDKIPLVDRKDVVIGSASKKECHLKPEKGSKEENGLLHRAFSVFLFNTKNELLLQQRSATKITFPNQFTNSCCSHPRFNEAELNERDNVGIKIAAQRRLEFELGIPSNEIPLDSFDHLTRIHYSGDSDEKWCEHELDHILICRRDLELAPNTDEVQQTLYLGKNELKNFLRTADSPDNGQKIVLTPWFRYIANTLLFDWWDNLHDLSMYRDTKIHRAGKQ